ncbi:prominin-1-A [Elysia marginata]|uniref:Prominin-1-A n=1 Tax=Elysia marginata TaxID=1093978 RepID=A0AAV4J048_9GAST|nr:prominin-1-A [Elysia marginata]
MQRAIDEMKNLKANVLRSINTIKPKEKGRDILKIATKFDKFRWYGGLGLAGLALLADLLLLVAVSFGICGGSSNVDPGERSKVSNSGGNLLLAGSVFAFLAAWLLVVVTVPAFLVGAPSDALACAPIRGPTILDKLINQQDIFTTGYEGNGTWLGNQFFPGSGADLGLAKLLRVCSEGGTVYSAFQADFLDMDEMTSFSKVRTIGIAEQIK